VKKKIMFMFVVLALLAVSSFAQAPAQAAPYEPLSGAHQEGVRWGLVSAAFVLGIAAAAGAIGQGRAVAAACEGIARNPGAAPAIRLAMIIGLALIESLVIYALIIAFVAVGK
jgi:F-type H+-transporting ATPase subunit c